MSEFKTRFDYLGLSTESKPTAKAVNGSTFKEVDTSKDYIYYKEEWYEKVKSGGGFPPDWTEIGYTNTPSSIIDGFNYAEQILNNWNNSVTLGNDMFFSDKNLKYFPLVDTSNLASMYRMFTSSNLENLPLINTGNCTNMRLTFSGINTLKEIPSIDTKNVTDARDMFSSCGVLLKIPQLNLIKLQYAKSMFSGCDMLSNESLNNIMASLITAQTYAGTKTLKDIGLSQTQATTCTTLSNYQDFLDAGWTTGY